MFARSVSNVASAAGNADPPRWHSCPPADQRAPRLAPEHQDRCPAAPRGPRRAALAPRPAAVPARARLRLRQGQDPIRPDPRTPDREPRDPLAPHECTRETIRSSAGPQPRCIDLPPQAQFWKQARGQPGRSATEDIDRCRLSSGPTGSARAERLNGRVEVAGYLVGAARPYLRDR